MELPITNVINISVSEAQAGAGEYNTSNLALFTTEEYNPATFGSDGYKIYLSPTEVGEDFGTDSETYKMANKVFAQQPNILAGNGYLVIIPVVTEVQSVTPVAPPASGVYRLNFGADQTADIAWNATAAQIQTAVRTLTGLEKAVVTGTLATAVTVSMYGYYGNAALMTVSNSTIDTGTPVVAQVTAGQDYVTSLNSAEDLVQFFGLVINHIVPESDMDAVATAVQALNKIAFFVSRTEADIDPGGMIDDLRTGGFTQSRGLYYGADNDSDALGMMAAYAGRALSTNFNGSNTTSTMHLKDLATVEPDPSMTQTILNKALAAGADTYVSLQGVSKVFCSGANQFFDQVYNLQWFVGALQITGFNFLAQAATKVPQTEAGMDGLKGAYRQVCEQAVTNQYSAPGRWNSSTTFGVQSDFLANILQRGYYIYSQPISQQSQAAREDREAPLVQIALKEAGAIHSSAVIVNVNA